jgi:uncharacterized membrane protein
MFYNFIHDADTPLGRQLRAGLVFITLPIWLIVAVAFALIGHALSFITETVQDLYEAFRFEIPEMVSCLIRTTRTGELLS